MFGDVQESWASPTCQKFFSLSFRERSSSSLYKIIRVHKGRFLKIGREGFSFQQRHAESPSPFKREGLGEGKDLSIR